MLTDYSKRSCCHNSWEEGVPLTRRLGLVSGREKWLSSNRAKTLIVVSILSRTFIKSAGEIRSTQAVNSQLSLFFDDGPLSSSSSPPQALGQQAGRKKINRKKCNLFE